jgi:hypothetical protein
MIKVDHWGVVSVGCGPLGQQREPLGDAGQRLVGEPSGSLGDAKAVILGTPGHPEIGTGLDGFHRVVHRTPIRHDDAVVVHSRRSRSVNSQRFSEAYAPLILLYADMTDHGLASRMTIWKLRK